MNLIQIVERAGTVIDLPQSQRPRISDAHMAEVLHETQFIAGGNLLAIRNANAISELFQVLYTRVGKFYVKFEKCIHLN